MTTFNLSDLANLYHRNLPEGSCSCGKLRYTPEKAAEALELARLRRDVQPWRQELRTYFCPLCQGIHLTKQSLGRPS